MLQFFNDAPASNDPRTLAHAGNGFLMRRGYTVAWLAWQGDLLPGNGRLLLDLPVARECHGPVTGLVRTEYIADRPGVTTFPLSGRAAVRSHPTVSLDPREARLTRRRYPYDERVPVPPENWCFARVEGGTGLDNQGTVQAVIPSDSHIHIPGGFEPGWIYELVYTGRDPLVLGLGHAAVRDFVCFLRYGEEDCAGRVNPLREPAERSTRRMPGAARKPAAACAILSIAGSIPMLPGAKCSTASCRMSQGPAGCGSITVSPTLTSRAGSNTRITSTRPTPSRSLMPRRPIT